MDSSAIFRRLLLLLAATSVNADRLYTIKNNCPTSITVYISGTSSRTLSPHATFTKSLPETWDGFVYTSANNGSTKGTGTKAGFYGQSDYYYIVQDPSSFNAGISIVPGNASTAGFCKEDICDNYRCDSSYSSPPTSFPVLKSIPPSAPLYACPGSKVDYTVTFCPSGAFPAPTNAVQINPNGNTAKCLDVRGAKFANGTAVQIYDCNGTSAQRWLIQHGRGVHVQVAGTPYCLDAGSHPSTGVGMKIWTCISNLPAQEWYYTYGTKSGIYLTGTNLALDLTDGSLANGNQVQTYAIYPDATNQIWTTTPISS